MGGNVDFGWFVLGFIFFEEGVSGAGVRKFDGGRDAGVEGVQFFWLIERN